MEFDGSSMAFEVVLARPMTRPAEVSRVTNGMGRQNLTSFRDGLCPGSDIHNGTDGREVAMGLAKLAEAEFARMQADTHTEVGCAEADPL